MPSRQHRSRRPPGAPGPSPWGTGDAEGAAPPQVAHRKNSAKTTSHPRSQQSPHAANDIGSHRRRFANTSRHSGINLASASELAIWRKPRTTPYPRLVSRFALPSLKRGVLRLTLPKRQAGFGGSGNRGSIPGTRGTSPVNLHQAFSIQQHRRFPWMCQCRRRPTRPGSPGRIIE